MNETTQQAIVQTLREKILAGELSPGQRLVEAQLAQWLGVSRTPLRLASCHPKDCSIAPALAVMWCAVSACATC
jgi:hypothetical protein